MRHPIRGIPELYGIERANLFGGRAGAHTCVTREISDFALRHVHNSTAFDGQRCNQKRCAALRKRVLYYICIDVYSVDGMDVQCSFLLYSMGSLLRLVLLLFVIPRRGGREKSKCDDENERACHALKGRVKREWRCVPLPICIYV